MTVQTDVTDRQALQPYFWLRISGVPFYIFGNIAGTADPFTRPANYPTIWAKRGLIIPDDHVEQRFNDLIGGVARPERMKLTLLDFDDPAHPGIGYFSRLFAPGRVLSSLTNGVGQLASNIAADGSTSTFFVRGGGPWTAQSDVYVGAEAVGISLIYDDGAGTTTMQIITRNKYPAMGTTSDASSTFPATPYHRIGGYDSALQPTEGTWVANDIMNIYGRVAAVYMGSIGPSSTPGIESDGTCIMLGRVTAIDTSNDGTGFQMTIDSITSDLDKALVAPDLAHDTISPGIYLLQPEMCRWKVVTGAIGGGSSSYWGSLGNSSNPSDPPFQIPQKIYTKAALITAMNAAMSAVKLSLTLKTIINQSDGLEYFRLLMPTTTNNTFTILIQGNDGDFADIGDALGMERNAFAYNAVEPDSQSMDIELQSNSTLTGIRSVASIYVPLYLQLASSLVIMLSTAGSSAEFIPYTQSVPATLYLVRLGNGSLLVVNNTTNVGGSIAALIASLSPGSIANSLTVTPASLLGAKSYYVNALGAVGTVEQVIAENDDAAASLGRMLCSSTGAPTDAIFNYWVQGAGIGWNNVVSKDDFRVPIDPVVGRVFVIDRTTKFNDYYQAIAREFGLFILWDPSISKIRLRYIQQPTAAAAANSAQGSSFIFSEANRAKIEDRTLAKQDRTSMRGSWKVQTGWDNLAGAFTAPDIIVNSLTTRSFFPNDIRQEDIPDKSFGARVHGGTGSQVQALIPHITSHSVIYQFPWTVWHRSVNKTALMLSPGTFHQIVDNTLANPFTVARCITAADGVYAILGGISKNYRTGECTAELYVLGSSNTRAFSPWSPCALVDHTAATNGYDTGTKILTLASHYTKSANNYDGVDFAVGDKVRIVSRHNDSGYQFTSNDTIASKAGAGRTVTLTTGIAALAGAVEYVMLLDKYHLASTSRKQGGATSVTWQGNGSTRRVDTVTTTSLFKWQ